MKIVNNLAAYPNNKPTIVTIGNFDGIHLGHQYLIKAAKRKAIEIDGELSVITFTGHPLRVLQPDLPIKTICSLRHKIELLRDLTVDNLILMDFTEKLADQSPQQFLGDIKRHIPLKHLVLGHDARIGKDKSGDREIIKNLSSSMNFSLTYLKPYYFKGKLVCSSLIREKLTNGNLDEAEIFLGRKFSFYGTISALDNGKWIIEPEEEDLLFPPGGRYLTEFRSGAKNFIGELTINEDLTLKMEVPESLKKKTKLNFTICKKLPFLT